jgi:hypothetical protein
VADAARDKRKAAGRNALEIVRGHERAIFCCGVEINASSECQCESEGEHDSALHWKAGGAVE